MNKALHAFFSILFMFLRYLPSQATEIPESLPSFPNALPLKTSYSLSPKDFMTHLCDLSNQEREIISIRLQTAKKFIKMSLWESNHDNPLLDSILSISTSELIASTATKEFNCLHEKILLSMPGTQITVRNYLNLCSVFQKLEIYDQYLKDNQETISSSVFKQSLIESTKHPLSPFHIYTLRSCFHPIQKEHMAMIHSWLSAYEASLAANHSSTLTALMIMTAEESDQFAMNMQEATHDLIKIMNSEKQFSHHIIDLDKLKDTPADKRPPFSLTCDIHTAFESNDQHSPLHHLKNMPIMTISNRIVTLYDYIRLSYTLNAYPAHRHQEGKSVTIIYDHESTINTQLDLLGIHFNDKMKAVDFMGINLSLVFISDIFENALDITPLTLWFLKEQRKGLESKIEKVLKLYEESKLTSTATEIAPPIASSPLKTDLKSEEHIEQKMTQKKNLSSGKDFNHGFLLGNSIGITQCILIYLLYHLLFA